MAYGFLFYSMSYYLLIKYYFDAEFMPDVAIGSPWLQAVSCNMSCHSLITSLPYLLIHQDVPVSCTFPASALKSV